MSYISHTPNICLSLTNYLMAAISEIPEGRKKNKTKKQNTNHKPVITDSGFSLSVVSGE